MALLFDDSFDHYATADMTTKWSFRDGGNVTIDPSYGRFSTGGCKITYNSSGIYYSHAQTRTLICGIAVKVPNSTPGVISPIAFCTFPRSVFSWPWCGAWSHC